MEPNLHNTNPQPPLDLETPEHQSKVTRGFNRFAYLALAFIAVIVGLFTYWAVVPVDVLEVKNAPIPVSKVSPKPVIDGSVTLRIDFCKHTASKGDVRTSFVGTSREVFLPKYTDNLPAGCGKYDIPVIIPSDLKPDKYHVHYRITYQVNPIKTVVEEFDSRPFDVN